MGATHVLPSSIRTCSWNLLLRPKLQRPSYISLPAKQIISLGWIPNGGVGSFESAHFPAPEPLPHPTPRHARAFSRCFRMCPRTWERNQSFSLVAVLSFHLKTQNQHLCNFPNNTVCFSLHYLSFICQSTRFPFKWPGPLMKYLEISPLEGCIYIVIHNGQ